MRYEWKKIFANPHAVLLLIAALLLNGYLFYRHCTDSSPGYTEAQIRAKYGQNIDIEEELRELDARSLDFTADSRDLNLITGDVYLERRLDREVLSRMEEAERYADYLQEKQTEIRARLNSGFMGPEGSFPYEAQLRVAETYRKLEGIQPEVSFSGGIAIFTHWHITDLLLLLFCLTAGLFLMTREHTAGLLLLLRPTARGKASLYAQKFLTLLLFVTWAFVILYGTDFVLSGLILGFGRLSRPIQSVTGLLPCPMPLTVGGYLLRFLLEKLLWLWAVSAIVFLLCTPAKRPTHALLPAALVAMISLLMGQSNDLWLQSLSLSFLSDTAERYSNCLMMNFFGLPVPRRIICPIFCALLLIGCFLVGLHSFCKKPTVPVAKGRSSQLFRPGRHTSLTRHEAFKQYVSNGGIFLLIVFAVLQALIYTNRSFPISQNEYHLQQYAKVLAGAPNAQKDDFLIQEAARFEEIRQTIDEYYSHIQDAHIAEILTNEFEQKLMPRDAFEMAKAHYENLGEGEAYVHQTGYTRLFGPLGIGDDLLNVALLLLFLSLSLGRTFSEEAETGVAVLLTTTGAQKRVRRRKLLFTALTAFPLFCIAFLPQWFTVHRVYGLEQPDALAQSVTVLRSLPKGLKIWQVFVLTGILRGAVTALGCGVILHLSKKTENTATTMLASIGLLVLPPLIARLLL